MQRTTGGRRQQNRGPAGPQIGRLHVVYFDASPAEMIGLAAPDGTLLGRAMLQRSRWVYQHQKNAMVAECVYMVWEIQPPALLPGERAGCIRCGCTDRRCCSPRCGWTLLDPAAARGVCSGCLTPAHQTRAAEIGGDVFEALVKVWREEGASNANAKR